MRATATYDLLPADLIPARKRLLDEHYEMRSWHTVAKRLRINVRYVYNFAVRGYLPQNPKIRRKLIGRKTINEHLATDRIADMPEPLLSWALENRVEMTDEKYRP